METARPSETRMQRSTSVEPTSPGTTSPLGRVIVIEPPPMALRTPVDAGATGTVGGAVAGGASGVGGAGGGGSVEGPLPEERSNTTTQWPPVWRATSTRVPGSQTLGRARLRRCGVHRWRTQQPRCRVDRGDEIRAVGLAHVEPAPGERHDARHGLGVRSAGLGVRCAVRGAGVVVLLLGDVRDTVHGRRHDAVKCASRIKTSTVLQTIKVADVLFVSVVPACP